MALHFETIFNNLPSDMKYHVKQLYWEDYIRNEARFNRAMSLTRLVYPFWCPDNSCFAFDEDDMKTNMPQTVKEIIDHVVSEIYSLNDKNTVSIASVIEHLEADHKYDVNGDPIPYYRGIEAKLLDFIDQELYIIQFVRYPIRDDGLIFHFKYLVGKYFPFLGMILQCEEPVY